MPDNPDLMALLGSRICHDLISPIGAISNGVELLMMDGSTMGPEIALISESVANANARIRFFRVAYGASGADQKTGQAEVVSILSDLTRSGRLTIDWRGPADLPRREVKLAFLGIQCLETAMAFGGRIEVNCLNSRWTLTGTATKLKVDGDLWEVLTNPAAKPDITAAQVHFALIADELSRQNRRLTANIEQTQISIHF
jgi:histidine phosphotransferase ChpT